MAKRHRTLIIIAIVVTTLTVSLLLAHLNSETNSVASLGTSDNRTLDNIDKEFDKVSLLFAENFVSYIIEDGKTMSFNIFGVQNVEKDDPLVSELISYIEFDNQKIEIVDFKFDSGIIYNNFKLINIIVDVENHSDTIEKAEQLLVHLKNGELKTYDIGMLSLKNDRNFADDDISPKGNYTVSYPTPSLDVTLNNDSEETVKINQIDDLTGSLSYNFDEVVELNSQEATRIVVPSFKVFNEKEFDFYTVTPILHYTSDNGDYLCNMPGVLYGIFDSDIEKIKRIID